MGKNNDLKRRLIQLYSALLYNAHIRGFAEGKIFTGRTKAVCVPGFNCYSCPGAVGACPLGSLQNALGSLNKNIGFYVFGIILLYGMLLGRTVCGWLCPLGLIQELLHKIPTPKIPKSRVTRVLSYLKYVILAVFVVIIPVYYGIFRGIPVPGFCKFICPAGTGEGAMGLLPNNPKWLSMLGPIFTEKFVILVVIGLACIFCYRSFCRFLCPLGAIYGMFNKISVIGVRVDNSCNNCGACVRNCKMDVSQVGDHECIHCAKCVAVCNQNAISLKAGKVSFPLSKNRQIICWSIAAAALAVLIVWTNFLDPTVRAKAGEKKGAVSAEAQQDQGYDLDNDGYQIYTDDDGDVFYLNDDGDVFWMDEDGALYYVDDDGNYAYVGDDAADDNETYAAYDNGTDADEYTEPDVSDDKAEADVDVEPDEEEDSGPGVEADEEQYESNAPTGYEVGERLQDFDVQCLDGSTFSLSEAKGKVVVINLWATYCGPCVKELPLFADLYHEHEGDIAMLAVHSRMAVEDVGAYLSDKDWDMQFVVDDADDRIFNIVNGSLALPQTIVLNRKGEVIYNKVGSVSAEVLERLYEEASAR